jgi:ferric-dicitrate binding protein FerR (iron transport regulator)
MNPEILERYFRGQCSQEEQERVERWLLSDDAPPDPFAGVDKRALRDEIWKKIEPRTPHASHAEVTPGALPFRPLPGDSVGKMNPWLKPPLLKLAAGLALFLGLGYLAARQYAAIRTPDQAAAPEIRRFATANGQKARITLPDGSIVHLNGGSEIRYPKGFTASAREVELAGEACFQVAKDSARPFTVRTSKAWTQVLGTVFDVRAYPDENTATVVVSEGRVAFAPNASALPALFLTKDRMGRCGPGGQGVFSDSVNAGDFLAWKDNRIVFVDRPLSEIARFLERWYGVEVEIRSEALAAQRFTGRYDKPKLPRLLKNMALAIGFRYTVDGTRVILEGK